MVKGLYTSAVGMTTQMKRMDVLTNNIANADTAGFKKDIAVTRSFPEELAKRLADPNLRNQFTHENPIGNITYGVYVNSVHTDFSMGALKQTGNPLDLALADDGFFTIKFIDKNGNATEKLSRDGSFVLNEEGYLVTKEGFRVQGLNGDIYVPTGDFYISDVGGIVVDDTVIDTLKLTTVENKETLRKYGHNLYSETDDTIKSNYNGQVLNSYLESSNVNIVKEMVEMITVNRIYDMNSKAIQSHDQTLGKAVTEIARR